MRLAAAVAVVAALTSVALAQPGATPPTYGPPPTYNPPPPPAGQYGGYQPQYQYQQPQLQVNVALKSSGTAFLWSIGATVGGLALIGVAADEDSPGLALAGLGLALIGPSAGHIYAGENGHAVKMSLLRGGALLVFVLGAIAYEESDDYYYGGDCFDCGYYEDDSPRDGEVAMWVGGLTLLGATLYDVYDAGRAATRYNDRARKNAGMMFAPMAMKTASGGTTAGMGLSGSF